MADENGAWRTISGRRVFIRDGQSLTDAMRESGKFEKSDKGSGLPKIKYNEDWAYQPDDDTDIDDLRENPIPYVGVGEDMKIGMEIEDETVQPEYKPKVPIDISKLETLQPFVLESGIVNYKRFDGTDTPYVVQYKGRYFLMDGNHRVAREKLKGKKTVIVDISVREHK